MEVAVGRWVGVLVGGTGVADGTVVEVAVGGKVGGGVSVGRGVGVGAQEAIRTSSDEM